ncbi:MAG: hypothetical protein ACYDCI_00330 [Candidatus Limnocylindrales bacterium]
MTTSETSTATRPTAHDAIEPPPAWWADVWVLRQIELRHKIRVITRGAPKIGYTQGSLEISCHTFDRREVTAALASLVGAGDLVAHGGRYHLPAKGGTP